MLEVFMKRSRTVLSLTACALALLSLVSCGGSSSSSDNSSASETSSSEASSSASYTYGIGIDRSESKISYDRYESFDSSSLIVYLYTYDSDSSVADSEQITDFTVYNTSSESELEDGYVFSSTGSYKCEVHYGDYVSDQFTISVTSVRNFTQSIEIVEAPEKYYHSGDTFSDAGMELSLVTTYYNSSNTRVTREEDLGDYTLKIGTQDASSYTFSDVGRYELTISATGTDGSELNTSLGLFVISKTSASPEKYVDDTITLGNSQNSASITITNSAKTGNTDPNGIDTSSKGYYSPDEVDVAYTFYDYGERNAINWKYAPSTGETPLLVVPAVIPGYEEDATPERLANLEKVFFGDSDDLHYESLHSYYYKSSYGKLDITGTVTDYFYCADESTAVTTENSITGSNYATKLRKLAQECADWASDVYGLDLKEYDSDSDGYIDGMWVIWIGPEYSSSTGYWPCSTTTGVDPDLDKPTVNNVGWAGNTFIEEYSAVDAGSDAHVIIHETGHMFGLADYYSYAYSGYAPLGCIDMMDFNLGDHNPYSKLMLGWTTPYIVYGNNVTININDLLSENSVIVIPYDSKTYSKGEDGKVLFNPFDEYLLIDLYTDNTKLNEIDYPAYSATQVDGTGVRIYHVDQRLGIKGGNATSYTLPSDPDSVWNDEYDGLVYTVISNTEKYLSGYTEGYVESYFGLSSSCNAFDEVRLISADGNYLSQSQHATNAALFQSGDTFSVNTFSSQFVDGEFDTDEACSAYVTIG